MHPDGGASCWAWDTIEEVFALMSGGGGGGGGGGGFFYRGVGGSRVGFSNGVCFPSTFFFQPEIKTVSGREQVGLI